MPIHKWGFRSGSTRMLKFYLTHKTGFGGKTTRQELLLQFTSPGKGIFMVRHKYLQGIIQSHQNLGVLQLFVPHTEEYTMLREDFLALASYELPDIYQTIKPEYLPETIVLLREPGPNELASYSMEYFQRYFWSLLFHAEIHKLQMQWERQKRLSDMDIALFIESVGLDCWEDVKEVLCQKNLLFNPSELREVFYEFIAYYLQLYNFAPQTVSRFFPMVKDPGRIHSQILDMGIEELRLLNQSRPLRCISTDDLIFLRDMQLEDPDHDLDLFKPAYYIDRIYGSPAVEHFESREDEPVDRRKEKFKEKYSHFILDKLVSMVISNSKIIGEIKFGDVVEKVRLEIKSHRAFEDWTGEKLLRFDSILADGLYTLYKRATWFDRLLVQWRGVVCLQDVRYGEKKERAAKKFLSTLERKETRLVEKISKGRHWSCYLLFPLIAVFKILAAIGKAFLWLPKIILHHSVERLEPYYVWAQRLADRKRKKIFTAVLKRAITCEKRGNIVGSAIHYKKVVKLVQKIYQRIEATEEEQKFYWGLKRELDHKLDEIEKSFAREHELEDTEEQKEPEESSEKKETRRQKKKEAREKLREMFQYLKDITTFHSVHQRLLQDIQKSYIDPNRKYFRINFLKGLLTLGMYPFKETLECLPLKKKLRALHAVERRLCKLKIREKELKGYQLVVKEALESLEIEARRKWGGLIGKVLDSAQIVPGKISGTTLEIQQERIAYEKIKEELVDLLVEKGYLQFADLRDVISRNDLKLNDVSGIGIFFTKDSLLKCDHKMGRSLAGLYRPAEVYMKAIHRFNALLFGTPIGRWLCRYIFLPFVGAFLLFELLYILIHIFYAPELIFLAPIQPFYPWLIPHLSPILCKVQPALTIALGSDRTISLTTLDLLTASGGAGCDFRVLLDHAVFTLFKIAWSLLGGLMILFFAFTSIGYRLANFLWDGFTKTCQFVFADLPEAIWYSSVVQFFYKLKLWSFLSMLIIRPAVYSLPITLSILYFTNIESYVRPAMLILLGIALANGMINTRGRWMVDNIEEFIVAALLRLNSTVFVGLFHFVMEIFRILLKWLEQILYLVDDFFRFRQGDHILVHIFKTFFGKIWYTVNYVSRFTVNLIVEPQVNPIKHFPVVTVSHKILLPFSVAITGWSKSVLKSLMNLGPEDKGGLPVAIAMAVVFFFIQFGIPGICGFIAWELKENWKLYRHSRARNITPLVVGSHGETLATLLKPGFHSGTIPRLYRKMRQNAEHFYRTGNRIPMRKVEYQYHYLCERVNRFAHRCLKAEFTANPRMRELVSKIKIGKVAIYNRHILIPLRIEMKDIGEVAFDIHYELKDNFICAYLGTPETMPKLPPEIENYLEFAIAAFWKKSAVNIVEAQVHDYFTQGLDIDMEQYRVLYELKARAMGVHLRPRCTLHTAIHVEFYLGYESIIPKIIKAPENRTLKTREIARNRLVFQYAKIPWADYNKAMAEYAQNGTPIPENLLPRILPKTS